MEPTILHKYLVKGKEIKQSWTRLENFDICFCVFFDRYYQDFISGATHWALGYFLSQVGDILSCPKLLKP